MTIGSSLNLLMGSAGATPPDPSYKLDKLAVSLGLISYSYPAYFQGLGSSSAQSFSDDGTYMYSPGNGSPFVFQATSATPFVYPLTNNDKNAKSIGSGGLGGCFMKPDGTRYWITSTSQATLRQFDCPTAFNMSTSVSAASTTISAAGTGTRYGVFFSADGTKAYISSQTSKTVEQYTLTVPWDITGGFTYASKQLSLATQITAGTSTSIFIKSDGTALWAIANGVPASGQATVYEYAMSTPWDISTGSYTGRSKAITQGSSSAVGFKDDGTVMYTILSANASPYDQGIISMPLSTAWDITTGGVQTVTYFNANGARFSYSTGSIIPGGNYILTGDSSVAGIMYLPTAWNLSLIKPGPCLTHSAGGSPWAIRMRNGNTKVYLLASNQTIYEYTLSVAKDLDSATYTGRSLAITTVSFGHVFDVSHNGTKIVVVQNNGTIKQWTMSTPWDLSTATYNGAYTPSGLPANPACRVAYSSDGYKIFVDCDGRIYGYPLTTAWDVGTAGSSTVSMAPYRQPNTFEITPGGNYLFSGHGNYAGVYSLPTLNDVTSSQFNGHIFHAPSNLTSGWLDGTEFNASGTALYTYESGVLRKYTLSTPWDMATASLTATKSSGLAGNGIYIAVTNEQHILIATQYSNTVFHYQMTTPGDISTTTLVGSYTYTACFAARFSSDGNYLYAVVSSINVYSYPLSTPFSLATAGTGTLIGSSGNITTSVSLAGLDDKYMLMGNYSALGVKQYSKTAPGTYASPTAIYNLLKPVYWAFNDWVDSVSWGNDGMVLSWMTRGFTNVTSYTYVKYDIPA